MELCLEGYSWQSLAVQHEAPTIIWLIARHRVAQVDDAKPVPYLFNVLRNLFSYEVFYKLLFIPFDYFYFMDDASKKYRLDKTAFQARTVQEADDHYNYWKNKSMKERLSAACYLNNQFYGTTPQTPVNKTVFTKRKHKNG